MLEARVLKQEPSVTEEAVHTAIKQGITDRWELFRQFKATFANNGPENMDGIRGSALVKIIGTLQSKGAVALWQDPPSDGMRRRAPVLIIPAVTEETVLIVLKLQTDAEDTKKKGIIRKSRTELLTHFVALDQVEPNVKLVAEDAVERTAEEIDPRHVRATEIDAILDVLAHKGLVTIEGGKGNPVVITLASTHAPN